MTGMWYGKSDSNYAEVMGICTQNFMYSHSSRKERFYRTDILVDGQKKTMERIPVIVPAYLLEREIDYAGKCIEVQGQLRSYNLSDPDKNRMLLHVYAKLLFLCSQVPEPVDEICLKGMIWQQPALRETGTGSKFSGFIAAVNRPGKKTDYIPCICRGENALYVSKLEAGSRIKIRGRLQSRDYIKIEENNRPVHRTTCEVFVRHIGGCEK